MATNLRLEEAYYSLKPGSLRDPKALHEVLKRQGISGVTLKECKEYLSSQTPYTLHRRARIKYPRNPIQAQMPGQTYQIDIMSMMWNAHENDGYKYALIGIDTYCKLLAACPIKDRKPASIISALDEIVNGLPFTIQRIYCDQEGSFLSKQMKEWLKARDIIMYTTSNEIKAANCERAIRHIRNMCARYFTWTKTERWIDFLPIMVDGYNERPHSTVKHRPIDLANDPLLYVTPRKAVKSGQKLPAVGSLVRLNKNRGVFEKESQGTFTTEVFRITAIRKTQDIEMAELSDMANEKLIGRFYAEELQKVEWDGTKEIENIIKRRVRNGRKEIFVKYLGWPKKFNEWIPE